MKPETLLISILLYLAYPVASFAQYTITGNASTGQSLPVAGATVGLSGTSSFRQTVSDINGDFSFADVGPDLYEVTIVLTNYSFTPIHRTILVPSGLYAPLFAGNGVSSAGNPLDMPGFFVRQQYVDLLKREPDQGGLDFWMWMLTSCGSDNTCIRRRRAGIVCAFTTSAEYQYRFSATATQSDSACSF